jgi:hypothetical protein
VEITGQGLGEAGCGGGSLRDIAAISQCLPAERVSGDMLRIPRRSGIVP